MGVKGKGEAVAGGGDFLTVKCLTWIKWTAAYFHIHVACLEVVQESML